MRGVPLVAGALRREAHCKRETAILARVSEKPDRITVVMGRESGK
jgi:hypothetical protein